MVEVGTYEKLLAEWRKREQTAQLMREFRDAGGQHRLQVQPVHVDPVIGMLVADALNDMMTKHGWEWAVGEIVAIAEAKATAARAAFEGAAMAGRIAE